MRRSVFTRERGERNRRHRRLFVPNFLPADAIYQLIANRLWEPHTAVQQPGEK
jgi:hypothetical protein